MEHRPIERAKLAARENPGASVSEIVEASGVGRATAQRARKLVASELSPETKPEPQPEPVDEREKKTDRFRATVQKTLASWAKEYLNEIGLAAMQEIIIEEGHAWSGRLRVA